MAEYFHSVRLMAERCKGCVNCIKRCPTEAIRIRGGRARITEVRCIDCGECIRRCPNHAKTAVTDCLADLAAYQYNIVVPAPSLYAQFDPDIPVDSILSGLLALGFDDVFEVAVGAEIVSLAVADYLESGQGRRPAISSACPAVVRLIQVKFPELIEHLVPFNAPVEVAARIARAQCSRRTGLAPERIGVFFLTPCPAKVTAVKQPLGQEKSHLSGAIGLTKIYADLRRLVSKNTAAAQLHRATWRGVGWAVAGGESTAIGRERHLVVDEIHNVSDVLEQVALGKLADTDYIECLACAGGCIGGPLTVVDRFVAEQNMRRRLRHMQAVEAQAGTAPRRHYSPAALGLAERKAIEPRPIMPLDKDIFRAMYKVELMEKMLEKLPGLDCGSCGSPNCKALAEDIVQGTAAVTDCVFKLRERVRDLAQEMVDLAEKLPPSLDKDEEAGAQHEAGAIQEGDEGQ